MKKIYFIIWTVVITAMFVSCERDEVARLSTISVSSETFTPSYNSVLIETRFETIAASNYKPTLTTVYAQYSPKADFEEYEEALMSGKDYSYKVQLSDLQDNTTYYIRYVAANRYSSAMTEDISEFKTLQPSVPTIALKSISDIWDTHAKAEIALSFDGGAPILEMGICWDTQAATTVEKNKLSTKDTSAILDITSLQPNTKYYVRAYAKNKTGINYSEEKSFLTYSLPEVRTNSIEDINIKSAQLSGFLVFDGNDTNTKVGFCWSETSNPTVEGEYHEASVKNGKFSYLLSDLKDETKYYVRAYAKNKIGVVYSEELPFITLPALLPTVETTIAKEITINSAIIEGKIVNDGSAIVTECGVVCSTHENPTTQDNIIASNTNTEIFSCYLGNLQKNTIYYVRAYAINKKGIAYGKNIKFDVADYTSDGEEKGYEYIDLGLNVKWAIFNIGASEPENYGYYYAWGETSTKSSYTWANYKYCNGTEYTLTKYNLYPNYGVVDNREVLELSDDAAYVKWGGNWHIPTIEELDELVQNCTWTWTTKNDVYGYKITSNVAGYSNKSIFLPAAGYKEGTSYITDNTGNYWCSSNEYNSAPYIDYLRLKHDYIFNTSITDRYVGLTIRPVCGISLPIIGNSSITDITSTSVTISSEVISDGGADVTERGVVYSANQNPTISNSKVISGSGTGSYTCSLTNLQEGTTYYIRAYAVNKKGTSYGQEYTFTTISIENGYEYVDLGLSVKWATMNVGADSPKDYGDYFAWGEILPKNYYDWSTYKFCNGSNNSLTKYNTNNSYGVVDNKTRLDLSDDAAHANWGGNWRMPTDAELDELRTNCIWTWTVQNGVNGYKVTSKSNENYIFLPATGSYNYSEIGNAGKMGYYWSSSSEKIYSFRAQGLDFISTNVNKYSNLRCSGHSVRPVCP